MEIRGLGIVSVPDLFGLDSVREAMAVDLVCRLVKWQDGMAYERVGFDRSREELDGVSLPTLRLPARPGSSMATVVEVAAKEHLRRVKGVVAARSLDERVRQEMLHRD